MPRASCAPILCPAFLVAMAKNEDVAEMFDDLVGVKVAAVVLEREVVAEPVIVDGREEEELAALDADELLTGGGRTLSEMVAPH
ncbi:hypothetical protein GP486_008762 [Trichoglossum hirsutum]|uniref:Uncharacterized protein n=1 Tax=Trichoglossum hirsutum TaxID=265104 RepID=A0A9P8I4E7_9PEZI|nr:hypothetical protein GP486_008762 [Trichoglossum hirsutum]